MSRVTTSLTESTFLWEEMAGCEEVAELTNRVAEELYMDEEEVKPAGDCDLAEAAPAVVGVQHTEAAAPPNIQSADGSPHLDSVVKVFCKHTKPNFSLPWQKQYSSISSGFVISGRRLLTTAHSVQHHTQVRVKKRSSDRKFLATVLAVGSECDLGMPRIHIYTILTITSNFSAPLLLHCVKDGCGWCVEIHRKIDKQCLMKITTYRHILTS